MSACLSADRNDQAELGSIDYAKLSFAKIGQKIFVKELKCLKLGEEKGTGGNYNIEELRI